MLGKLIKVGLVALVIAILVRSIPDIKRYLEIRAM
jgi:hypothetical protein